MLAHYAEQTGFDPVNGIEGTHNLYMPPLRISLVFKPSFPMRPPDFNWLTFTVSSPVNDVQKNAGPGKAVRA